VNRIAVAVALALFASGASAAETLGVIAVGDPPVGPDGDLAELAHQLRAACRDRVGGVEEVSTMRGRLLGQLSDATVSELDRAYGGALAVYQNGEFESALRTLRAIVEDLESLPESEESYFQWKRALLRLAHAAMTVGRQSEAEAAFDKLAQAEPDYHPDPDSFSPSFRRRFEERKARLRALPRRRLLVVAEGWPGTVFMNGKQMGTTPLTLTLPAGKYRVGGAAGSLRVPSFQVDLEAEDRTVVLDFGLAQALRVNAGPGLALSPQDRAYGIIRAGAWLGADNLVVVSRAVEDQAQFLLGSLYDVRRGVLLREGSVRMVAGGVPSVNLAALASFLLTGQSSREVKNLSDAPRRIVPPPIAAGPGPGAPFRVAAAEELRAPPALSAPPAAPRPAATASPPRTGKAGAADPARPPNGFVPAAVAAARSPAGGEVQLALDHRAAVAPPSGAPAPLPPALEPPKPTRVVAALDPPQESGARPRPRRWMTPAAIGAGVITMGFTAIAIQQGITSSATYADAEDMVGAGGTLKPGMDPVHYNELRDDGAAARRNTYITAGVAAVFAVTTGILGWKATHEPAEPAAVAFRF
jgi:hypothetical protein